MFSMVLPRSPYKLLLPSPEGSPKDDHGEVISSGHSWRRVVAGRCDLFSEFDFDRSSGAASC